MKIFKSVDVVIQVVTIVLGILIGILNPNYALYPYFIVGGWQLLSCLIHGFFQEHFYPVKGRRFYLISLAVVFIWAIISIAGQVAFFLYFLLFCSPLMAIWYCFICYKELKLYEQREWIQLK